jgi:hypothetical protein
LRTSPQHLLFTIGFFVDVLLLLFFFVFIIVTRVVREQGLGLLTMMIQLQRLVILPTRWA